MIFEKKKIEKIDDNGPWVRFMDMHSGGDCKESPFEHIFIQAPLQKAEIIFYNVFGHNPNRVTCTCCGEDYSIIEYESFSEASKYEREGSIFKNRKNKPITIVNFSNKENVLVIRKHEIKDSWKKGSLPEQGYVWL